MELYLLHGSKPPTILGLTNLETILNQGFHIGMKIYVRVPMTNQSIILTSRDQIFNINLGQLMHFSCF